MTADLAVGDVDDLLLATLRTAFDDASLDVGVGDMVTPPGYGWPAGVQPNSPQSLFKPYIIVTTNTAQAEPRDTIGATQGSWHLPYLLQSFGTSREMCRWMGDKTRVHLADQLIGTDHDFGASTYRVQQLYVASIGGVNRASRTDPAFYSAQDGIEIWISRNRRG